MTMMAAKSQVSHASDHIVSHPNRSQVATWRRQKVLPDHKVTELPRVRGRVPLVTRHHVAPIAFADLSCQVAIEEYMSADRK